METAARAQANNDLRAAITARYALLEQEERALRDNASNRAAAQARATTAAQQAHQQDLDNLREYITQKYAILNREEAIEKMNASNAAEIARLKTMRTRQAQEAADAQRDADFLAYKADLVRQEVAAAQNAERMNRIERARQRDAKRAADDDRVRQLNDWRMQQALMQRAAIDTQLTVTRMGGGFGGAAMAMGQASYAAEDFAQVLSMGGGLNMALMSASNNLSMVVRALLGTSGAMAAVAGVTVPAVLIGSGMLIQHFMKEEEQVDLLAETYRRLSDELQRTQDAADRQLQHQFNMQDIDELTTYAAAAAKLQQEIKELAKAERDAAKAEEQLAAKRNALRDAVAGGSVIRDAQAILDSMRLSPDVFDWMDIATAEDDVRHLTKAYEDLADTIANGTPSAIATSAEEFRDAINSTKEIGKVYSDFSSKFDKQLSLILGTEEERAKLGEVGKVMNDLSALLDLQQKQQDEKQRTQEATNRLLEQENRLRQEGTLFQLQATEAQKSEMDIRQKIMDYIGFTRTQPQDLDVATLLGQNNFDARDFLNAYTANLEQTKQDMLDQQKVSPVGGMEQNGFQAQADAFRQMLDAQYKQEDPQLRDIDTRIQQSNELLRQLTEGPGVVRVP
jgi:hypothetical protein